jgi:MoaA/NifB/PqqE/SkfB family radical SAM enzyme
MTTDFPKVPPEHFCIAPFQSTRQNAYGRNSPCAFGAGEWRQEHLTPLERWHSTELNELRQQFLRGEKPEACHRCWSEEQAGKRSLRQRQFDYYPDDYENFLRPGLWMLGPKTAVFKTSNICNLACRSCGGWDSNFYAREGQYYVEKYQTKDQHNPGQLFNRFIPVLPAKHMDFMQYKDIAQNLEKIDFFGGEPLLNISQLDFLEYLVEQGLSKKITLFYSTNCTNHPTERLKRAWNNFKRVEISVSIDGIGTQFEYMRWPGRWSEAEAVLEHFLSLKDQLDCEVYVMAGLTVSLLNVWDIDHVHAWLSDKIGQVYINMVNFPEYLSLHTAPDHVKLAISQHVKNQEVLGYLNIKPSDPVAWKQFIIWTKRQDEYRQQQYEQYYPEFVQVIQQDWETIVDLTEESFYG